MSRVKASKSERLASMLGATGVLRLVEATGVPGRRLLVLAYHRVLDIDPEKYPFDEEVVSASCDAFDQQMAFVKKSFDVITFADLKKCLEGGISVPKRPLIITFDD